MQMPINSDHEREAALLRYIEAFDRGDLEAMANVLELAMRDATLDHQIASVDEALHTEAGLRTPLQNAQRVRQLLFTNMPSGIPLPAEEEPELTVADVASRMNDDRDTRRRLSPEDRFAVRRLLDNRIQVPLPLTARALRELIDALRIEVSDTFWELLQETATILGVSKQQRSAQLAAARRQGRTSRRPPSFKARPTVGRATQSPASDSTSSLTPSDENSSLGERGGNEP